MTVMQGAVLTRALRGLQSTLEKHAVEGIGFAALDAQDGPHPNLGA